MKICPESELLLQLIQNQATGVLPQIGTFVVSINLPQIGALEEIDIDIMELGPPNPEYDEAGFEKTDDWTAESDLAKALNMNNEADEQ